MDKQKEYIKTILEATCKAEDIDHIIDSSAIAIISTLLERDIPLCGIMSIALNVVLKCYRILEKDQEVSEETLDSIRDKVFDIIEKTFDDDPVQ